jgi:hypothetical protein
MARMMSRIGLVSSWPDQAKAFVRWRRIIAPTPPKPTIINAQLAGSGMPGGVGSRKASLAATSNVAPVFVITSAANQNPPG